MRTATPLARALCTSATLLLLILVNEATAQDKCDAANARHAIIPNRINALVHVDGHYFQNDYEGSFLVPFNGKNSPSALFSAAPWVSAFDLGGNLRMSRHTFQGIGVSAYAPGPLNAVGEISPDQCAEWDRIWSVRQFDIVSHLEDFETDGQIDSVLSSIYGWPGKGNIHFADIHGFELPDRAGFGAPFADLNGNDIYEPHLGEYPHPENVAFETIVSEIVWFVFNDNGSTRGTQDGDPLRVDIQQTFFGLVCDSLDFLNTTLFSSTRITNRSGEELQDMIYSHWSDPDLGCFTDDYVGSDTLTHTGFIYNEDNEDGTTGSDCPGNGGPKPTYGENPPVFATTFLNREMSSFWVGSNAAVGNPPPGTVLPNTVVEARNVMRGRWIDGTPIFASGDGYLEFGADTTTFHFFGDPNEITDWSLMSVNPPFADRQIVQSANLGDLQADQSISLDMAFSLHRKDGLDHLANITLMYAQVAELRSLYDSGMSLECSKYIYDCGDDCVYPGDANHDGIADHSDYHEVLASVNASGEARDLPITWDPHTATDWEELGTSGIDLKHADNNGNGTIDFQDLDITSLHLWNTSPYFTPVSPEFGDEITIKLRDSIFIHGSTLFSTTPSYELHVELDSAIAISFEINYDSAYWKSVHLVTPAFLPRDSIMTESINLNGRFSSISYDRQALPSPLVSTTAEGGILRLDWDNIPDDVRDTTYISIVSATVLMPDGTIRTLKGNRYPVIIEPVTSSTDLLNEDKVSVFPNPSDGKFNIVTNNSIDNSPYEVLDLTGRVAASGLVNGKQIQFNVSPGTYVLRLLSDTPKTALVVVSGK